MPVGVGPNRKRNQQCPAKPSSILPVVSNSSTKKRFLFSHSTSRNSSWHLQDFVTDRGYSIPLQSRKVTWFWGLVCNANNRSVFVISLFPFTIVFSKFKLWNGNSAFDCECLLLQFWIQVDIIMKELTKSMRDPEMRPFNLTSLLQMEWSDKNLAQGMNYRLRPAFSKVPR